MNTPADDALVWHAHEDTVRRLLWAHLDHLPLLYDVADDLRPGNGGRWEGLPPECEARRRGLLADLATRGAEIRGCPWPFPDDDIIAPDSPADLDSV